MRYKPTDKFASLDQSSSYQGLSDEVYRALKRGEVVDIESPPEKLMEGGYIEPEIVRPIKEKKHGA